MSQSNPNDPSYQVVLFFLVAFVTMFCVTLFFVFLYKSRLKNYKETSKEITNLGNNFILVCNSNNEIMYCNKKFVGMLRIKKESIIGRDLLDIKVLSNIEKLSKSQFLSDFYYDANMKIKVRWEKSFVRTSKRNLRIVYSGVDLSVEDEIINLKNKLFEANQEIFNNLSMMQMLPFPMFIFDRDKIYFYNKAFGDLTLAGFSSNTKNALDLAAPGEVTMLLDAMNKVVSTNKPVYDFEGVIVTGDKKRYTIIYSFLPIDHDKKKCILGVIGSYKLHKPGVNMLSDRLSEREIEIATYVADEIPNSEIAKYTGISPNTVSNHKKNICKKLSLSNVKELTEYLQNLENEAELHKIAQ